MRLLTLLIFLFCAGLTAEAVDKQWFVAVYAEHYQHVTGASATANVVDGEFLSVDFVGKEMYVRNEEHYELDEFRPIKSTASISNTMESSSSDASAVAENVPDQPALTSEFGPLVDTGLQYVSGAS